MGVAFTRFCFFVQLLLVLSTCAEAVWLSWLTSPFHSASIDTGKTDHSDTEARSERHLRLPPLSARRQKTDAWRDRHMSQLMNELEEKTRRSSCWKKAVNTLKEGCTSLRTNDEARSRLALAMASCDGETDGGRRVWRACSSITDVQWCVDQLDDAQYLMYAQYRLHSDVLCLFILEEAFQERSDNAVQALYTSAMAASDTLLALESSSGVLQFLLNQTAEQQSFNLAETLRLHDLLRELSSGQSEAFESLRTGTQQVMRHLLDTTSSVKQLHLALKESAAKAAAAVGEVAQKATEFQERTEVHVSGMLRVLERVDMFQQALLEKTMGFGEVLRCASLLLLLLLFTIPARTAAARLPCVGVMCLAYALRPLLPTSQQLAAGDGVFFVGVTIAVGSVLVCYAYTYCSPEYTLRILLRGEIRHAFDDMRLSLMEDIRQTVTDGVVEALNRVSDAHETLLPKSEKRTLLITSSHSDSEGTCALPTIARSLSKKSSQRSRSRVLTGLRKQTD